MIRALALALLLATAAPAWARSQTVVTYPGDRVFAAAVRFVRVDLDAKLVDKDAEAGYVVFEYVDDGKAFRSSLEVIATDKGVTIVCDIADRPDYLEQMLLDRLRRRLREDLGDEPRATPAKPAKPADPKPAPDA